MKKGMNKKKILIIAGSVLAVGAIAAVLLFVVFAPKLSDEDILKDPSAAKTFCDESPEAKQSNCYFNLAEVLSANNEQLKAIEICNALSDKNNREDCYGMVKSNSQSLDADAQLAMCDSKTGVNRDDCYRNLAETSLSSNASKSVEICNKISEKSTKDSCLNGIIGNPEIVQANVELSVSICDSLTLKSNCYSYVAQTVSGSDPEKGAVICQKLSDDNQMLNCYHSAWFDFNSAVLQNPDFTISLCNKLNAKRDECLRGASEIFMTTNKAKAEEICRLASASTVEGCLHVVQSG